MDRERTYGEYLAQVGSRYNQLSEDEKDVVRAIRGTQQGLVLSKILGNEFHLKKMIPKNKTLLKIRKW